MTWLQPGAPRCPQSLTGNDPSGPRALERHPPAEILAALEPGQGLSQSMEPSGVPRLTGGEARTPGTPQYTQPSPRAVRISKPGAPPLP